MIKLWHSIFEFFVSLICFRNIIIRDIHIPNLIIFINKIIYFFIHSSLYDSPEPVHCSRPQMRRKTTRICNHVVEDHLFRVWWLQRGSPSWQQHHLDAWCTRRCGDQWTLPQGFCHGGALSFKSRRRLYAYISQSGKEPSWAMLIAGVRRRGVSLPFAQCWANL